MEGKKIGSFPVIILLILLLAGSVLFYKLAFGWYPAKYTKSAHGNYANRSTISSIGYAVGHCAHCHEQHASIEGASSSTDKFGLFAPNNQDSQDDNFCFQCHCNPVDSVQVDGITNYSYSKTFGGGSSDTPNNIEDAFAFGLPFGAADSGSSHNLKNVQDWITGKAGFTSNNNPCTACHNPHTAQKNSPVVYTGRGGVKTTLREDTGTGYVDRPTNLWGDENYATTGGLYELTSDQPGGYQAPYRVGETTTYEPAGDQTADGSNMPGYAYFCTRCHQYVLGSAEHVPLRVINWLGGGDRHGQVDGDDVSKGYTKAPYDTESANYILACTDCHEPHGSPNEWLLRTCVNGKDNIIIPYNSNRWYEFCTACHVLTSHHGPTTQCKGCHSHNSSF